MDVKNIKPGDKVTLEVNHVVTLGGDEYHIYFGKDTTSWLNSKWCKITNIEHIPEPPRPLEVGDKVTLLNGSEVREIKAIVGDMAWVTSLAVPDGGIVRSLATMKRVTVH